MTRVRPAIWIQAHPAAAPAAPPRCSGPAERVAAVLQGLRAIPEPGERGQDIVSSGRIVALDISADEATLTLRVGNGRCHGAHDIAECAFEVLRAQLPDTDLYLRHEYAASCGSAVGASEQQESGQA